MQRISTALHLLKRQSTVMKEPETHWVPNRDMYVSDEGLVIKVELSGMQREDLELMIDGNSLKITGQRADGFRHPQCKFLVMEINYGTFECMVEVPPGYDLNRAKAYYQNGFLRVDVPPDNHSSHGRSGSKTNS
jgi:HSP20 family molecular chaperone IbpA